MWGEQKGALYEAAMRMIACDKLIASHDRPPPDPESLKCCKCKALAHFDLRDNRMWNEMRGEGAGRLAGVLGECKAAPANEMGGAGCSCWLEQGGSCCVEDQ